jgi:hypothetical protein
VVVISVYGNKLLFSLSRDIFYAVVSREEVFMF